MAEQNNNQNNSSNPNLRVLVSEHKEPIFSNSVQINVSADTVVLQFLYVRPSSDEGILVSEIVLSPQHAIKFQKSLNETIKRHFTRHLNQ